MQFSENISPEMGVCSPRNERRIIRRNQVQELTGLKKSHIYALIKAGTFPSPVKLGAKAVGRVEQEITRWIDSRVNASRQAA